MFWETLWALILGFTLSGAVQAFVSKDQMQRDARRSPTRRPWFGPSGFGMVSSSCSYAATAMAKSLFQKGADFVSSMVFMFASTNLVIELGIVLVVLMGWQFAAAEFVGGPIMIVLLVAARAGSLLRGPLVEAARTAAVQRAVVGRPRPPGHGRRQRRSARPSSRGRPGVRKLRSPAAWSDAASYTMADITMLRKELVDRLRRRRVPGRAGADVVVERPVHLRPRLLDQPRERPRRPVHRLHQLRLLDRQRARWRPRCGTAASASVA